MFLSPSLSPSLPLSLRNKHFKKQKKRKENPASVPCAPRLPGLPLPSGKPRSARRRAPGGAPLVPPPKLGVRSPCAHLVSPWRGGGELHRPRTQEEDGQQAAQGGGWNQAGLGTRVPPRAEPAASKGRLHSTATAWGAGAGTQPGAAPASGERPRQTDRHSQHQSWTFWPQPSHSCPRRGRRAARPNWAGRAWEAVPGPGEGELEACQLRRRVSAEAGHRDVAQKAGRRQGGLAQQERPS